MCKFKAMGVPWPPRGWDHFKTIHMTHGQSIHKDPQNARIIGLQYDIHPVPNAQDDEGPDYDYEVMINGWEYTISNDSNEFPILSFRLRERRSDDHSIGLLMTHLKVYSKSIVATDSIADRTLMASLFFIRQIQNNRVPDWDRILKFYRLCGHHNAVKENGLIAKNKAARKKTIHFNDLTYFTEVEEKY